MSFSRRTFLKAAGSLALASSLRSARVQAATGDIPKRIVLFFTPHGTVWNRWRPTGTETNFDLSYILEPLQRFKSKLNILDGIALPTDGPGAPHTRGPAVLFTGSPLADDGTFERRDCSGGCSFGWNTHHSVDQEIARRLKDETSYPSLEFGVVSGGGFPGAHINYAGPARPLPPKQNPRVAFDQLFASQLEDEAHRLRALTKRRNILTTLKSELAVLDTRVSTADRIRLEAHADAIRETERALTSDGGSCALPARPENRATNSPDFRPWALDRQIEILSASLACGLTRVASLQFRVGENDGGSNGIYSWLGHTEEHHLSTHDNSPAAQQRISEIYRWYASRFAYLLEKLDSYPEEEGTLLDHTLVVWGSELGDGRIHSIEKVPFVLAGGGRGGLRTGRYIVMPKTMNHRLLVSICHFMGATDVQKFGTLDRGSGPLTVL